MILKFVKSVATKKGETTILFPILFFLALVGSAIRDSGWIKIRIRDKHPGSPTLAVDKMTIDTLSG
jgi:hypothetical protein